MEKLKLPASASGSRGSPPASAPSARAISTMIPPDRLPKIFNRSTDADIPKRAWSSWTPDVGARMLRRPLNPEERRELEVRAAEVAPALVPYGAPDLDAIVEALSGMFGGYSSMRQTNDEAAARLEGIERVLEGFPAWAIVKVCRSIQANGVWREGKFDRKWPPNDSEVVLAVRAEVKHYEGVYRSASGLLWAEVEKR